MVSSTKLPAQCCTALVAKWRNSGKMDVEKMTKYIMQWNILIYGTRYKRAYDGCKFASEQQRHRI